MINVTLFKDKSVQTTFKIRSKDRTVLTMIIKRLKQLTF